MERFLDFIKETWKGRTLYRILFSWKIQDHCKGIERDILDIGGGQSPTYLRYLSEKVKFVRAEPLQKKNPDLIIDMNQQHWDVPHTYPNVFCHNTLYIAKDPQMVLGNIYKILSHKGTLFLTTPFVFRECPEPDDYYRFTSQKLKEMLEEVGFKGVVVEPFGKNFSSAAYILYPFLRFRVIKLVVYSLALLLDRVVPKRVSVPLGFFVIAKK